MRESKRGKRKQVGEKSGRVRVGAPLSNYAFNSIFHVFKNGEKIVFQFSQNSSYSHNYI